MAKYKICPKCSNKNLSYSTNCSECNVSLEKVTITETASPAAPIKHSSTGPSASKYVRVMGVVQLVFCVVAAIAVIVVFSTKPHPMFTDTRKVFAPAGIVYGVSVLFGGLLIHSITNALSKILESLDCE